MIGFLNWGGECLLRGTSWVFILDRMRFVFKGLIIPKVYVLDEYYLVWNPLKYTFLNFFVFSVFLGENIFHTGICLNKSELRFSIWN
jgi:hypothetical protein